MKIDRPNVDVKPFASQSKTEERTVFGSKEITDKLEKNLNSDFYRGWGIVPVSELPTMQDFNAVEFTISGLAAYLFQNGMAEYADKQTYYKNSLCVFEGDIYKSKTDNNAGNPLTDKTQWQSLKDAILSANIVQQTGSATDKVMSQKVVTEALNTKQQKGDYATKIDLTQGLNTKLNSSAVKQATGNSTTEVMSQKAITDALNKATSIDGIYPVGIVLWFAQNKNPNTLFPNTKWQYIGENKTIRLAKIDGSNVLTTGGTDSIKLTEAQLPAHGHTFSATTSSFDYGTKTTNNAGAHVHVMLGNSSPIGNNENCLGVGGYRNKSQPTESAGAHVHTVAIGAHVHTVSGTTANKGSGNEINITNAYVTLMCWYRVS